MDDSLVEILLKLHNWPLDTSFNKEVIDEASEFFNFIANSSGIEASVYHFCITSILQLTKLTNHKFQKLLHLCMPENSIETGTLAEIVVKCLAWATGEEKITNSHERCQACLQYLIGLLKYNIIDQKQMKIFYHHIYTFLSNPLYEQLAAQLIYYMTNQENLTNWCVLVVQKLIKATSKGPKSHLKSLLALFSRLKPEYISMEVEERSFPKLSAGFERVLEYTRQRMDRTEVQTSTHMNVYQIAVASNAYPRYVLNGSSFKDVNGFLRFYLNGDFVSFGTSYLSLLEHPYNFVYIGAMGDEELMKFQLYLKRNFSMADNTPPSQTKSFLRNVYHIKEILDDVIDVEKDLKKFLREPNRWSKYFDEICPFVATLQFKSYRKFWNCILKPLYEIFVSSPGFERKRKCVDILSKFLLEQYKLIAVCESAEDRLEYLPDQDIFLIVDALKYLTQDLINLEPATFETKFCVLQAYERLVDGESLVGIKGLDIVPVMVARQIPITNSAFILEFYATILDNSFKIAERRAVNKKAYAVFYMGKQITELYNFLTHNLNEIGSPLVAWDTTCHSELLKLRKRHSFKLTRNIAFWPYTRIDESGNWLYKAVVDKKRLMEACPTLVRLLTNVKLTQKSK